MNTLSNPIIDDSPGRENESPSDCQRISNSLKEFRVLDDQWLKNNFEKIITKRNRISKVISWEWKLKSNSEAIRFKYFHPPLLRKHKPNSCLKIYLDDKCVKRKKIPLDIKRFDRINKVINTVLNTLN